LLLWLFFDVTRKKEVAMKRFIAAGIVVLFIIAGVSQAVAGGGMKIPNPITGEVVTIGSTADEPPGDPPSEPDGPFGSAPQSGDGVSDGSGLDSPNGPNVPK
jgi:hypothetical protein